jgi:hypothetical protein
VLQERKALRALLAQLGHRGFKAYRASKERSEPQALARLEPRDQRGHKGMLVLRELRGLLGILEARVLLDKRELLVFKGRAELSVKQELRAYKGHKVSLEPLALLALRV